MLDFNFVLCHVNTKTHPVRVKPRSLTIVDGYCKNLLKYHDELADLKSYFDGVRTSATPQPEPANLHGSVSTVCYLDLIGVETQFDMCVMQKDVWIYCS